METVILTGNAMDKLAELESESVHCCVTSPPYWGLRDYKQDGQIGMEKTPDEYVTKLVAVFREVRRVLRKDGTLWLNLGDSYCASMRGNVVAGTGNLTNSNPNLAIEQARFNGAKAIDKSKIPGLKPKDLVGIPWLVAFALRTDGWYLRRDIIWHKPNPMPESVTDRCTSSHEYIFHLSKSAKYYYDADAIRESPNTDSFARYDRNSSYDGSKEYSMKQGPRGHRSDKQRGHSRRHAGFNDSWDEMSKEQQQANGANKRSVWTIATQPYPEAHFATFPEAIPNLCIRAGCPPNGTVLDPFAGSGTTLAVAVKLGRNAIGIELNPEYVKLIEKRLLRTDKTRHLDL